MTATGIGGIMSTLIVFLQGRELAMAMSLSFSFAGMH